MGGPEIFRRKVGELRCFFQWRILTGKHTQPEYDAEELFLY